MLHDHGVSRRHARIFTRGGRLFLVDLGSSAGTLCNGKALGKDREHELRGGDRLAIGAVEFVFSPLTPAPSATLLETPAVSVRPRSSTRVTRAQTEQEMQAIEREDTGRHRIAATEVEMPAVVAAPVVAPTSSPTSIIPQATVIRPSPLAKLPEPDDDSETTVTQSAESASRLLARGASALASNAALSAAEKARLRRQRSGTLGGRIANWWSELTPRRKSVAGVVAGLAIVALVGGLVTAFLPERRARPRGTEPTELDLNPVADSFGLGQDVTWSQPDQKLFHFQFASPTRAVAVLHYQARDIATPQEVSISLNGAPVAWVPPDSQETDERELQVLLPLQGLRRDAPNELIFDNVHNPPGQDPWRIWNMYVEVIPVPELPVEQLLAKAREEAAAGRRFYEQKDVGSENLFKAWKLFRSAWLTLEALDQKPDLYNEVLFQLAQLARELDQTCRLLMLDFQRSLQFRDGDKARATVEEVMRRFPTTEHRCHNLALEKANQYELPL